MHWHLVCKLLQTLQTLHAVAALNDKRGRCLGQIITKAHWLPFFSIFRLLGARRRWFLWPTEVLGEAVAPSITCLWNENSVIFGIYISTTPPSMRCVKRSNVEAKGIMSPSFSCALIKETILFVFDNKCNQPCIQINIASYFMQRTIWSGECPQVFLDTEGPKKL